MTKKNVLLSAPAAQMTQHTGDAAENIKIQHAIPDN